MLIGLIVYGSPSSSRRMTIFLPFPVGQKYRSIMVFPPVFWVRRVWIVTIVGRDCPPCSWEAAAIQRTPPDKPLSRRVAPAPPLPARISRRSDHGRAPVFPCLRSAPTGVELPGA